MTHKQANIQPIMGIQTATDEMVLVAEVLATAQPRTLLMVASSATMSTVQS